MAISWHSQQSTLSSVAFCRSICSFGAGSKLRSMCRSPTDFAWKHPPPFFASAHLGVLSEYLRVTQSGLHAIACIAKERDHAVQEFIRVAD